MTQKEKEIREFLGDFKIIHIDSNVKVNKKFDGARFRHLAAEVSKIYSEYDENVGNENNNS